MPDPVPQHRSPAALAVALVLLASSAACGKKGPPSPPLPRGPFPAESLSVRQIGGRVLVGLDIPQARGPKPSQTPYLVEVVRVAYAPGLTPAVDPDSFRRRGETVAQIPLAPDRPSRRLVVEDHGVAQLPDAGVGQTLRYAVRVRDRRGRSSPLVISDDLVPIEGAPAPIIETAEPTADGVRLNWRISDEDQALKFNIYRTLPGAQWPQAPLNTQPLSGGQYLDTDVETGETYLYAVRVALADDPPYREGSSSEAYEIVAADRFPPTAPTGLVVVQEGSAVRLFWNPNRERDVAGYRLYRRIDEGAWLRIGADAIDDALFLDTAVEVGQRVSYRITAVDRADPPNESPQSEEVYLVVIQEPIAPGSGSR